MNVLILHPRLDVSFKQGAVPENRSPIAVIRVPWQQFTTRLVEEHQRRGDTVTVLEKPLWQFQHEDISYRIKNENFKRVYVPHKERHQFPIYTEGLAGSCTVPAPAKIFYYTQTQFPWLFSIDAEGWGGGASVWPIHPESGHPEVFEALADWSFKNNSKFEQPQTDYGAERLPDGPFMFLPCQLPHDETIRFHSSITMAEMVECVCATAAMNRMPLVVKGHPVNPGSMEPLARIVKKYIDAGLNDVRWVEDISIHTILQRAAVTVTVNSGVGFESFLHGVPVVTFGRADYDAISKHTTCDTFSVDTLTSAVDHYDVHRVRDFFNTWVDWCYDIRKPFQNLPS